MWESELFGQKVLFIEEVKLLILLIALKWPHSHICNLVFFLLFQLWQFHDFKHLPKTDYFWTKL